ncbi:MAG: hypothetical protein AAFU79_11615 [Myxococcota bacterium]
MNEPPTDLVTEESIATYLAGPPPENAEFDFLLGRWTTETIRYAPDGQVRRRQPGRWIARPLHGGRIVLDETLSYDAKGREIASMATLRSYAPATRQWEMTFVVAHQPMLPLRFVARRVGDEMHGQATLLSEGARGFHARIRFFEIRKDSFAWAQEMSLDGGTKYIRTVEIRAKREG